MPDPSAGHELMRRLSIRNPTLLGTSPNMVSTLCTVCEVPSCEKQGLDRICGSTTPLHGYSASGLNRICGSTIPLHGYSASRLYLGSDPSMASHNRFNRHSSLLTL
ncbi:hypothetical protein PIB30_084212 [Stylosanthes scabra]|uniref:Uncharacterized protein n=1 Tax=Stylosanthes scabra TaxID=79078 RepID=A0ABU6YQ39_9FABA|nr:hypothetical protein [Stylosanthes scabra]